MPSKGKNVAGGKEYLRVLKSKQGARFFSQNTRALSVVAGQPTDSTWARRSHLCDAAKGAGSNTFVAQYGDWYQKLYNDASRRAGRNAQQAIARRFWPRPRPAPTP